MFYYFCNNRPSSSPPRSVSRNETAAPVPDTIERADRGDRAVRPEVRERGRRPEREQQNDRKPQTVGEQVQNVGEPELYGFADHRSKHANPATSVAQNLMTRVFLVATRLIQMRKPYLIYGYYAT